MAGTGSDAGKSVLVAGLCRWLSRQGVKVAPFKAQNMSLNSFVTLDGAEIGRAQAMQAAAAGIEPTADMNPVLLKPGSDRSSQVVVRGRADGVVSARSYRQRTAVLMDVALEALEDLRSRFDVVVCEGAGSPAEINLRATDLANMGLAQAADLPVIADVLNLSVAEVHGVVTFYRDFHREPRGTEVRICQAEACRAVGAAELGDHSRQRLGVGFGETTADGVISLDEVFCLGNCALGPAVQVGDRLHGRVSAARLDAILGEVGR